MPQLKGVLLTLPQSPAASPASSYMPCGPGEFLNWNGVANDATAVQALTIPTTADVELPATTSAATSEACAPRFAQARLAEAHPEISGVTRRGQLRAIRHWRQRLPAIAKGAWDLLRTTC